MALRLKKLLTSADVGVPERVGPAEFLARAAAAGFSPTFMRAFVPLDIAELIPLMHQPFEAPEKAALVSMAVLVAALA